MKKILGKALNIFIVIFVFFSIYYSLRSGNIFSKAKNNVELSAEMLKSIVLKNPGKIVELDSPLAPMTTTKTQASNDNSKSSVCQNPDQILMKKVITGQADLSRMADAIGKIKDEVYAGKGINYNISDLISVYNDDVISYQKKYNEIEKLRQDYNIEATNFNRCIRGL
jgi:cell shape-determining protein MreC